MVCTGEMYKDKHGNEYELIFTDDGDFMYDGDETFIEVKKSDFGDSYYDKRDVRRFFTQEELF